MSIFVNIPEREDQSAVKLHARLSTPSNLSDATELEKGYQTIIFIPPVWLDGFFFQGQYDDPILYENYNLVSFDLRGSGLTECEPLKENEKEYNWQTVADDVLALMDHLNLSKAHFVSYWAGSITTQTLASKHPERVLSILMTHQAQEQEPEEWSYAFDELANVIESFGKSKDMEYWEMVTGGAVELCTSGFKMDIIEDYREECRAVSEKKISSGQVDIAWKLVLATLTSRVNVVGKDELKNIKCPVLLIRGNGEACEPSEFDQKWVDDLNESVGKPIAELRILEDTCMFMCLTHPGLINPIMYDFFQSIPFEKKPSKDGEEMVVPSSPTTSMSSSLSPTTPRKSNWGNIQPKQSSTENNKKKLDLNGIICETEIVSEEIDLGGLKLDERD